MFDGCDALTSVRLPNSITGIADASIPDGNDLTIYALLDTYAAKYAKVKMRTFKAE